MARERIDIIVNERGAAKAARNVGLIGRGARVSAAGVAALGSALAGLGLAVTAGEFLRLADAFTTMNNQIRLVTDSQEQLVKVQREVFKVAQETRSPVEETTTLFRRLALASEDLGLQQGDVLDVTEAINKAIIVSGATSEEASAGIIQLSQGLASGALRGDELRSVLEQLPRIATAISKDLGVTRGELRELGKDGAITSEVVVTALLNAREELNAEFAKINATTGQSFTVLRNAVIQAVGTIDTALESTKLLSGGVLSLAEDIDVLIIDGFAKLLDFIAAGIDGFANIAEVFESFGVDATLISNTLRLIGAEANLAFSAIVNGLNVLRLGALSVASALELVGNAFGLVSDEEVLRGLDKLNEANNDLVKSSQDVEDAIVDTGLAARKLADDFFNEEESNAISDNLKGIADGTRQLADETRKLGEEARAAKTAVDDLARAGGVDKGPLPTLTPADDIIAGLSPEDQAARNQALFGSTTEEIVDAINRVPDEPEVDESIAKLSQKFGAGLADAAGAALRGESVDFTDFFVDLFTSELEAGLTAIFEDLLGGLQEGLQDVLSSAGGGAGGGGGLDFGAIAGGIGLLGGVVAAGLKSTSSSARTGIASSAVDAVAPTRGAIVGPSNIPIFQVGDAIGESIAPLISETVDQGVTLKQILAAVRTSGGGADLTAALDQLLRKEFNTSPSLG